MSVSHGIFEVTVTLVGIVARLMVNRLIRHPLLQAALAVDVLSLRSYYVR